VPPVFPVVEVVEVPVVAVEAFVVEALEALVLGVAVLAIFHNQSDSVKSANSVVLARLWIDFNAWVKSVTVDSMTRSTQPQIPR
jgi:hypothetical protein